jgi:hypothetical protein
MLIEEQTTIAANQFALYSPSPNPFKWSTKIRFALPHGDSVSLTVHNLLGQTVATLLEGFEEAGEHQVIFDAAEMEGSGGVYFVRLETSDHRACRKLVLFK